jgi:hypothetical protein
LVLKPLLFNPGNGIKRRARILGNLEKRGND